MVDIVYAIWGGIHYDLLYPVGSIQIWYSTNKALLDHLTNNIAYLRFSFNRSSLI